MNARLPVWLCLWTALPCLAAVEPPPGSAANPVAPWWSATAQTAVDGAGTNRHELIRALSEVTSRHRPSMEFLVENMPDTDRQQLSADFLLRHVDQTHRGFDGARWRDRIPHEVFLNDILPYSSLTEQRDGSRRKLFELAAPLIQECTTPGDAAQKLNQRLFPLVKVRYSTSRRTPDQAPEETMASGVATCTGLSILLVDACRAVGVPARVTGTPMWSNLRGNHTWAEVWDGEWHFTGAAEPDRKGLNRGWFVHDAAQAQRDVPRHAIYSSSFRRTDVRFPMVWAPRATWVSAVNVTDRYTPKAAPLGSNEVRLLVKVLDTLAGKRVVADVTITSPTNPAVKFTGRSRGETADLNDILPFIATRGQTYRVRVALGDAVVERTVVTSGQAQQVETLALRNTLATSVAPMVCYAPPPSVSPISAVQAKQLELALEAWFGAPAHTRAIMRFPSQLEELLRDHESTVRDAAWKAHRAGSAGSVPAGRTSGTTTNPVPRELTCVTADVPVTEFFWLRIAASQLGQDVSANWRDNRLSIATGTNVTGLTVYCDHRLVDFSREIQVELNGTTTRQTVAPSLRVLCESLARAGDPDLTFNAAVEIRRDLTGRLVVVPRP